MVFVVAKDSKIKYLIKRKKKKSIHAIVDGDEYGERFAVGLNGDDDDVGAIFIFVVGEKIDTPVR